MPGNDTEQDKYHDNEVVSVNTEDEGNAAQDDADQEAVHSGNI